MGRHRRSEPAPAPAPVASAHRAVGGRHRSSRRKRSAVPVRTGLLGASAAMAMGAVAVASGLLPGPNGTYSIGGGLINPSGSVPGGSADLQTQGTVTPTPEVRGGESAADRGGERASSPGTPGTPGTPGAEPSRDAEKPEAEPSEKPADPTPSPDDTPGGTPPATEDDTTRAPARTPTASEGDRSPSSAASRQSVTPVSPTTDAEAAAEAEVLRLVNLERAEAGCRPLTADPELAELAGRFSRDMAARGFFSHTGPDGDTPWDRAEAAGIDNLAAENIARGQANAQSVMDAWMDSPGHRANILNCDYRTLGVGAHFAEGGPWWTQNFGF
ncbi:CAP domain-containing protein [Streptomyces sp. TRM43335]|uniref:CAP domain-containing protein n=1 Tax=Streptomyces taklimakanensis TaxID=2569853 RepID=A0A6G2BFX4_9ACTN|nr:CAP domain-containing protein [Streptomyces taklimakanensis]MTE21187.1 CAP domain-containing protein [Streptomyces taklimakanensis]